MKESNDDKENRLDSRGYRIGKRSETSRLNGFLGGRPHEFDFDSDEFYDFVFDCTARSAKMDEIPTLLYQKYKVAIHHTDFIKMVNGSYDGWTEEENDRRSCRLTHAIKRAKDIQLSKIRNTYLTAALGGQPIKTTSTTRRRLRSDGVYTDDEEVSTTTTESTTQPNMAALATWLYHYDDDWRRVQRGLIPRDTAEAEKEAQAIQDEQGNSADGGIDLSSWIEKECEINSQREVIDEQDAE